MSNPTALRDPRLRRRRRAWARRVAGASAALGLIAAAAALAATTPQKMRTTQTTRARTTLAATLPATTPSGITLVEVVRELNASEPKLLWVRPGDADGRTLLTYDRDRPGHSACNGACAQEFPPLKAAAGAEALGDWSLVQRSDGSLQWAYQSHPLYTWTKEQHPGDVATNVGLSETATAKLAENPHEAGKLMPPADWKVARFMPAASMKLPDGLDVRLVDSAQAVALVDQRGMSLYEFDGDARSDGQGCVDSSGCHLDWMPLGAPSLASGIGEFSIVKRKDGVRQWAYRGHPLYEYLGDQLPGDAHGAGVDPHWRLAELTRDFDPPGVSVAKLNGYGDVLTSHGMTLYGGFPFEKRWGGRNLRENFSHSAYHKGKELGALACTDAKCLSRWRPLSAPADARAQGFWEPLSRPDGSRQWAYKGYALYTYAGDHAPGDHRGQAVYDFHNPEGDYASFRRTVFLDQVAHAPGGAGIYWNIAHP